MGLAQLLGHYRGRGVGIEKTVAQDLADGLIGAAVIGFGAGLLRGQSQQTSGLIVCQELVVALSAKAVLLGDMHDVLRQTLAFHEHEEAAGQLVGGADGQLADRANQLVGLGIELQGSIHGGRIARGRQDVQ